MPSTIYLRNNPAMKDLTQKINGKTTAQTHGLLAVHPLDGFPNSVSNH